MASDEYVEQVAKDIHESNRQAVDEKKVVISLGIPFKSWDEISEDAKEGRRMAARYLLERYMMIQKISNEILVDVTEALHKEAGKYNG